MAVDFNVTPLGGFNLGGAIERVGESFRKSQEREELKVESQRIKELTGKAASGDVSSLDELFATNPSLAIQLETRAFNKKKQLGEEQAALSQEAETDWGLRWRQASTPAEFDALKQEAIDNPLIDFDESDLSATDSQANLAVNTMLYRNMGKDAYKQFFTGAKQEKGTFTIKDTPTGTIRLNTATGQVLEIPSDSKTAKNAREKERKEFDRQLKETNSNFQRSKDIRSRYDRKTTDFNKVRDAFARIGASAESPDAAGDLSLIFNYMKMLDPGSTVREGEFATAAGAASVPERMKGAYERVISGKRLTSLQRNEFISRASKLMDAAKGGQERSRKEAVDLGTQWGVSELDIFGQEEVKAVNWGDL